MIVGDGVRVLEVEVVVAGLDLVDADFPSDFGFLPVLAFRTAPPIDAALQMLDANGSGHRIGFLAIRYAVLVEPDFLRRLALLEEQQIGADAGVRFEHAVGQAHDGVQVALFQQVFLEPGFHAFAKQRAVGQDDGGAAAGFQQADKQRQKQVGGFLGAEVGRKVGFDAVFFLSAKRRIGEDDVHPVGLAVADIRPRQGVVVAHEAGVFNAVQQHVGDAEHVRELLLLHGAQAGLHGLFVFDLFHIAVAHVADGAGEKAAGAAGRVEQDFAGLGVDAIHHESGDGAGRVILARVARALQVVEQLFVDVAEVLAFRQVVEIDAADFVDDLPQQLAGLHVVVGVFKHAPHHAAAIGVLACGGQFLELGEQLGVDEGQQRVAGDAFRVSCPRPPLQGFWDWRTVVVLHHLQLLILIVDDFEKEHPAKLGEALSVAIDADILAHDVLNGFNGISCRHGLGNFLIESGLQFVDSVFKAGSGTEFLDELERCSHRVEWGDFQNFDVIETGDNAFVLILGEQSFKHGTGLRAVFGEDIALFDVVGAFAAGQRRLVEGNVANQVEGIEVFADLFQQRLQKQPFFRQFFNDGFLALG